MKQKAFTLIEMLVVLGIIGIIAAFAIPHFSPIYNKAKIDRARSDIKKLEMAINAYVNDFGVPPPQDANFGPGQFATINVNLIKFLMSNTTYGSSARWRGPYLTVESRYIKSGQFQDPWNNPYAYQSYRSNALANMQNYINPTYVGPDKPNNNKSFVDLYSFGPDSANNNGAGDDINNWQQ
jgi:prepilin-type N-terminal cleavage/methylation domain-containing protein